MPLRFPTWSCMLNRSKILQVGSPIWFSNSDLTMHWTIRANFGLSSNKTFILRQLTQTNENNVPEPNHLLDKRFFKIYLKEHTNASIWKCDKKTYIKWSWYIRRAIYSLSIVRFLVISYKFWFQENLITKSNAFINMMEWSPKRSGFIYLQLLLLHARHRLSNTLVYSIQYKLTFISNWWGWGSMWGGYFN